MNIVLTTSRLIEPTVFEMDAYRLLVQLNTLTPELDAALLQIAATQIWQHLVYSGLVWEGRLTPLLTEIDLPELMKHTPPRAWLNEPSGMPLPALLSGWDTFVLEAGDYAHATAFVDSALDSLIVPHEEGIDG